MNCLKTIFVMMFILPLTASSVCKNNILTSNLVSKSSRKCLNNIEHSNYTCEDEFETKNIANRINSECYFIDQDGTYTDCKESIREETTILSNDDEIMLASSVDSNENNNTFSNASTVYSVASNSIGFYGLYIGWWASIHQASDIDYYAYDVIMNGTLKVDVSNIPSGCDYDLKIYRMGNSLSSSCDDAEQIASSAHSSNNSESISIMVTPGTYYAKVYPYNSSYDSENYYHIEFTITDGRSYSDGHYNISSHKSNGDLAAIWKSDFDPCSQTIAYANVDGAKVQFNNYDNYPMIRHLADTYDESKDIDYVCLYVWNLDLRKAIYYIASELYDLITNQYADGNQTLNNVAIYANGTAIILSVAGVIIGSVPVVGTIIGVSSLVASIAGIIFDSLNSSFKATINENENYFIALKQAMEVGTGTSNSEIVMMRIRYRFTHDNFLWFVTSRYIDMHQIYRNTDSYLYDSGVIDFYHEGSPINGSITGIGNADDLEDVLK